MNDLSRNLDRVVRRIASPPFMLLMAVLIIATFPFVLMAMGAIEFWAGIKSTFPKRERLNVPSGDAE